MTTVMSGSRARSIWLTGAAGLLLVVTAVVMMVCAAPRIQSVQPGPMVRDRLASWVWVTRDHWPQITPGTVGDLNRTHGAPVP
jgi:hypothetical protein